MRAISRPTTFAILITLSLTAAALAGEGKPQNGKSGNPGSKQKDLSGLSPKALRMLANRMREKIERLETRVADLEKENARLRKALKNTERTPSPYEKAKEDSSQTASPNQEEASPSPTDGKTLRSLLSEDQISALRTLQKHLPSEKSRAVSSYLDSSLSTTLSSIYHGASTKLKARLGALLKRELERTRRRMSRIARDMESAQQMEIASAPEDKQKFELSRYENPGDVPSKDRVSRYYVSNPVKKRSLLEKIALNAHDVLHRANRLVTGEVRPDVTEIGDGNSFGNARGFEVVQVVDDHNLLVADEDYNEEDEWFWMRGVSTRGIADGDNLGGRHGNLLFKVVGTKQYATAIGGAKTVKVIEPVQADLPPVAKE